MQINLFVIASFVYSWFVINHKEWINKYEQTYTNICLLCSIPYHGGIIFCTCGENLSRRILFIQTKLIAIYVLLWYI